MDILDKIGKTATSAYKVTADKTGKLAKEIKLKVKADSLKTDITKLYTKIGEAVCNNPESQEIKENIAKISELKKEVEKISEEIRQLKDTKKCIKCENIIDIEDSFCPKCGERQEEVVEAEIVDKKE